MYNSNYQSQYAKHDAKIVSTMEKIIIAATGALDLDTLLQKVVQILADFNKSERAAFFLYDEASKQLLMRAAHNHPPEHRFNAFYEVSLSDNEEKIGLATFSFKKNKTLVFNSTETIKNHPAHWGKYINEKYKDKGTDCHSLLCIPLGIPNKKIIGILKIENTLEQKKYQKFSKEDVRDFKLLANIISSAIIRFKDQLIKIDDSINLILSNALSSSDPGNLSEKLEKIAETFKNISNAIGVSIWLVEGTRLICITAIGKNYKKLKGRAYDIADLNKETEMGLTLWIMKSEEILNIKTNQEIINHPQYKGTYNNILYPDKKNRCESFIGAPLKTGNKIIGVIKADSRIPDEEHSESFFTTEEEQIFSYLSIITSIIIESEKEFEKTNRHNRQSITLYKLGAQCYGFDNYKDIFGYLLTGLTIGEGIGYNRAILFSLINENDQYYLMGVNGIGPINKQQGNEFHHHFDEGGKPSVDDAKNLIIKNNISTTPDLQAFIQNQKIFISKQCELFRFIQSTLNKNTSQVKPLSVDKCSEDIIKLFKVINTFDNNLLAISVLDANGEVFIIICDNVYSDLTQNDDFIINATNIFVEQISFALSRLSLTKSKKETTEEAWREFTAITAHRIGTETSIMSGAISFLKDSLKKYSNNDLIQEDINILENCLYNLKKTVREHTELQKPPELKLQNIKINQILDKVKDDFKRLISNETYDIEIINNYHDNLPSIRGDWDSLHYVFKELYENASKAMPDGGEINIYSSIINDNNNQYLQIKISDKGSGIELESLPKIFDRGYKGRKGGTGLGLYIVKRNIEWHEGSIKAENNQYVGASFIVTLPLPKSDLNQIMIVEDDDRQLNYLVRSIKGKYPELRIVSIRNENEAIELLINTNNENNDNMYNFIIADINLEDGGGSKFGGIRLLEFLKHNNIQVKVVIITAHPGMTYTELSGQKKSIFQKVKELNGFKCISKTQTRNYLDELNDILAK